MATYMIFSRLASDSASDPQRFKDITTRVAQRIKEECPGVEWRESYATLGQYDVVDVIEAENEKQVAKAAMIIRAEGNATTETLLATPWKEFLHSL